MLAAIQELTYQPNASARALASQRTQVIGLVVPFGPGADTMGLLPFIETIAACARARDHDVLLVTTDEGPAGLTRIAGQMLCDGIVLMDIQTYDERLPIAAALRVPVVLIGVPHDSLGLYCVDVDFPLAARMAVDELAATGHDRVVLIGHPSAIIGRDVNFVQRFQRGAVEGAAAHGIRLDVVAPVEFGRPAALGAVDSALASGGERVGLLIANSQMGQPILHALTTRGIVPGRDISVIGMCTDVAAEEATPPLTNVSLEPRDVSSRAMQTLFRLMDPDQASPAESNDLVAPHLSRRETVMPPAAVRTVPATGSNGRRRGRPVAPTLP